jgi:hypothetical protein
MSRLHETDPMITTESPEPGIPVGDQFPEMLHCEPAPLHVLVTPNTFWQMAVAMKKIDRSKILLRKFSGFFDVFILTSSF